VLKKHFLLLSILKTDVPLNIVIETMIKRFQLLWWIKSLWSSIYQCINAFTDTSLLN